MLCAALLAQGLMACSSTTTSSTGSAGASNGDGGTAGEAGASGAAGAPGTPITVPGIAAQAWDLGGGRTRLHWDFSDASQLADWTPSSAALSLVDGRMQVGDPLDGSYMHLAVFSRGLIVDSLSFSGRVVSGDHMNAYVSSHIDGSWNPPDGYGLIHYSSGRMWVVNGVEDSTGVGGSLIPAQRYDVAIGVTDSALTWAVNGVELSRTADIARSVDRQVALGAYGSVDTFDDITLEGTLAEP